MAFFFHSRGKGSPKPKKSHFYVWFLGAKEASGLKGSNVTIPAIRQLLQESYQTAPTKVTLQTSDKGVKIVQVVPAINKSGKIKMELMKFMVPHISISDVQLAPPPYDDTLAVVMLILNPETRCPIHVHCYRCDSPDTAKRLFTSLQLLVDRPDNRKRFADLEQRLVSVGLLPEASPYPHPPPPVSRNRGEARPSYGLPKIPTPDSYNSMKSDHRHEMPPLPASGRVQQIRIDMAHSPSAESIISGRISEQFDFLKNELSSSESDESDGEDETSASMVSSDKQQIQPDGRGSFYENTEPQSVEAKQYIRDEMRKAKKVANMHQAVFQELKQRLDYSKEQCPLLLPPKDYAKSVRKSNPKSAPYRAIDFNNGFAASNMFLSHTEHERLAPSQNESHNKGHNEIHHWSSSSTSGFGSDLSPDGARGSGGSANQLLSLGEARKKHVGAAESKHKHLKSRKQEKQHDDVIVLTKFSHDSQNVPKLITPMKENRFSRSDQKSKSYLSVHTTQHQPSVNTNSIDRSDYYHRDNERSFVSRSPDYGIAGPIPRPVFPSNSRHSVAVFDSFDKGDLLDPSTSISQSRLLAVRDGYSHISAAISGHKVVETGQSGEKSPNSGVLRRFGDTIKFQVKNLNNTTTYNNVPPSTNNNRQRIYTQNPNSNWITKKPPKSEHTGGMEPPRSNSSKFQNHKFMSTENLTERSPDVGFGQARQWRPSNWDLRQQVEHGSHNMETQLPRKSKSLWQLPTLVDPFGRKFNQTPSIAGGSNRRWNDSKWFHETPAPSYKDPPSYNSHHQSRFPHVSKPSHQQSMDFRRRSVAVPLYA